MASLPSSVANALARYWSEVYGGAANKLSTSDLWDNIRARAQAQGLSSPGVSATAISTLRGYASRMISAADSLAKARPELALTSSLIAEAPWSRPLQDQNAMPIYQVSFQNTIQLEDGSTVTKWQSTTITGQLPPTVGDLYGVASAEAERLAAEGTTGSGGTPKGTSLGITGTYILSV